MTTDSSTLSETSNPNPLTIYGVVLVVGLVCAVAVAAVHEFTRPVILRNRLAQREAAILNVLPDAVRSVEFAWDHSTATFTSATADGPGEGTVFAGFDAEGKLVGIAIEASGMGYQDLIRLLYGYSFSAQAIVGIQVLESRETPGLGDRIEKDESFLSNFERLDVRLNDNRSGLAHPIQFVKPGQKSESWQIDGITGATISSRAVAEMLSDSTATWIPRLENRTPDFAIESTGVGP
jgi:electron transport complex protein RnfG